MCKEGKKYAIANPESVMQVNIASRYCRSSSVISEIHLDDMRQQEDRPTIPEEKEDTSNELQPRRGRRDGDTFEPVAATEETIDYGGTCTSLRKRETEEQAGRPEGTV
ncbi:hypothetical protein Trydic_g3313 [Trypoxylus dichotomus]